MSAVGRALRLHLTDARLAALLEGEREPHDEDFAGLAAVLRSPVAHLELIVGMRARTAGSTTTTVR